MSIILVAAAALFASDELCRRVVSSGVEPAREKRMAGEHTCFARRVDEHELCGVACEMIVAGELVQGGGVNQSDPALHELGKRRFVVGGDITLEKRGVVCHLVDLILHPLTAKPDKKSLQTEKRGRISPCHKTGLESVSTLKPWCVAPERHHDHGPDTFSF